MAAQICHRLRNIIKTSVANYFNKTNSLSSVFVKNQHYLLILLLNRALTWPVAFADQQKNPDNIKNKMLSDTRVTVDHKLLLYQQEYSFYSQKVVMALHEKNIKFESKIVDITKNEQYEPWFLQINAKGEVPVLQDGSKIIPDSARIIDYLEDTYTQDQYNRLIPMDQPAEVRQNVTYFRNIISKLPANLITIGTLFHTELVENPKIPFIAPVRNALASNENKSSENLRTTAELCPEAREMLLKKAEEQDKKHDIIVNKEKFLKVLEDVDGILTQVETALSNVGEDSWLCSKSFTIADIELTMILERLNEIGLEHRFWTNGKRPFIEKYFARVRNRESYKQTIPGTMFLVKTILLSLGPLVLGVSVTVFIAIVVGGAFLIKKVISK